jgi:hypothetical protein
MIIALAVSALVLGSLGWRVLALWSGGDGE